MIHRKPDAPQKKGMTWMFSGAISALYQRRALGPGVVFLIVFLALYASACMFLHFRRIVIFTHPAAFCWMLTAPLAWWLQRTGIATTLSKPRAAAALLTRLTVIGILVAALAEPRTARRNDTLSVVYALDVSDSMGEAVSDESLKFVLDTAGKKPPKDEAGLVVFGREAAVELPPRQSFPFEVINARVARDGSDIGKGLSLASAVIPPEHQGRIVLVSDGAHTEADIEPVLEDLARRKIPVDVLPVEYSYPAEVWVERLDLPRKVKVGDTYEAVVLLSALQSGAGELSLTENGKIVAKQAVAFDAGKNRFALPLYLREPGYYEYAATIHVPAGQDGWQENNTAINFLFLKGEGRVLLIADPQGDKRDWEAMAKAMRESKRVVDVRSPFEVPNDALAFLPFDAIVMANVPAESFDAVQQEAIRDAVQHQGVGLLMVGGKNSYGPGGYHRTPIEEALPVSMDVTQRKVLPKGALVVVLHTCEFPEGNVWAKRIAKEAIKVLSAKDDVGILIYGMGGDQWVFPLTPAGQYESLVAKINQCEPSDMPSFQNIMQMGLAALEANDAASKHMIIISDGDPSPPTPAVIGQFRASSVSVSTVIIQPHGGQDQSTMQALAGATGGRYYLVQDPAALPSIFIKEAKTIKRSMIQNKTLTPLPDFPSSVLKGIDKLPELKGYVLTTPKPRSMVLLKTPLEQGEDQPDPVLAVWRFGLGKSAAFTGDLGANWAGAWLEWPSYQPFVKQLVTDLSRPDRQTDLVLQTMATGGEGMILVDDHHQKESMLELHAQITGPRQRVENIRLKQVGPRRYQARFPLWGRGRYQVLVAGADAVRQEQTIGGFVVAYSPEYLRFRSDPILLRRIASKTGGRLLSGREDGQALFGIPRVPRETSKPVFDWLLILLAILIPVDVAMRRVQLDWDLIKGWFRRKRQTESIETLGALLRRKEKVRDAMDASKSPVSPVPTTPVVTPLPARQAPPQAAPGPEEDKAEQKPTESMSTTERLLARKQQRKQD